MSGYQQARENRNTLLSGIAHPKMTIVYNKMFTTITEALKMFSITRALKLFLQKKLMLRLF